MSFSPFCNDLRHASHLAKAAGIDRSSYAKIDAEDYASSTSSPILSNPPPLSKLRPVHISQEDPVHRVASPQIKPIVKEEVALPAVVSSSPLNEEQERSAEKVKKVREKDSVVRTVSSTNIFGGMSPEELAAWNAFIQSRAQTVSS